MRANLDQLFTVKRRNEDYFKLITKYKTSKHYLHTLQLPSSPFKFPMFLLNIAANDTLLTKSGMLLHNRLPRNFIESITNVIFLEFLVRMEKQ